jgi:hypothetical protein
LLIIYFSLFNLRFLIFWIFPLLIVFCSSFLDEF